MLWQMANSNERFGLILAVIHMIAAIGIGSLGKGDKKWLASFYHIGLAICWLLLLICSRLMING